MGTVVPLDRLGVPFHEFATMIDQAVPRASGVARARHADHHPALRQYNAAQDDRYLAAVLATLTWIAGMTDNDPLTRQHRPATLDAQSEVRVAATAITYGLQDPIYGLTPGAIHPEWATGITRTLEWNLGTDRTTGRWKQPTALRGA
jgi:hypothetical protein